MKFIRRVLLQIRTLHFVVMVFSKYLIYDSLCMYMPGIAAVFSIGKANLVVWYLSVTQQLKVLYVRHKKALRQDIKYTQTDKKKKLKRSKNYIEYEK